MANRGKTGECVTETKPKSNILNYSYEPLKKQLRI